MLNSFVGELATSITVGAFVIFNSATVTKASGWIFWRAITGDLDVHNGSYAVIQFVFLG